MQAFVLDTGSSVRAVADLQDGPRGGLGAQRLDLCDTDVLTINGTAARETEKSDRIEYSVSWDLDQAPESFEFVLARKDEGDITAMVNLPPRFSIIEPMVGDQLPRSADTIITWDPPRDGGQILATVADEIGQLCGIADNAPQFSIGVDLPDSGMFTLAANTIVWQPGDSTGPTTENACDAFIRLARVNPGDYPGELEPSGRVEARVERRIPFLSVP